MDNLWAQTNALVQQQKMAHKYAELEDICASQGVNGYTKYIIDKETFEELLLALMRVAADGTVYFNSVNVAVDAGTSTPYRDWETKHIVTGKQIGRAHV